MPENESKPAGSKRGWLGRHATIIMGIALVGIVVIYEIVKGHAASSAAAQQAAAPSSSATTDPLTGYPYGSAADLSALGSSGLSTLYPSTGTSGGTTNNYYAPSPTSTSTTPATSTSLPGPAVSVLPMINVGTRGSVIPSVTPARTPSGGFVG
jgi:hypothetical protein